MADPSLSPANQSYAGAATLASASSEYNLIDFLIRQVLNGINTATLVRVVGVADGAVNVQPLVNQIDGNGDGTPHGTVYGLPFFRLLGGPNAVIIDPQEGDLGLAVFASRDISRVKATGDVANPGSLRQFDMADGVYLGGWSRSEATQFLKFAAGIIAETPVFTATGNLSAGTGASGSFTTPTGGVITVLDGIIVDIA